MNLCIDQVLGRISRCITATALRFCAVAAAVDRLQHLFAAVCEPVYLQQFPRDMGNCKGTMSSSCTSATWSRTARVMKPGREVSFHCMLMPTSKQLRRLHRPARLPRRPDPRVSGKGIHLHSEVCIWKDPVTAMQRTKALGLLHKTIRENASLSRQGIPDYLVTMRAPGDDGPA
jgi:hypothetical protein